MTVYYKAVRPDGTSFHDEEFRWVDDTYGHIVEHPNAHRDNASGYLSVATVPTDCTGMRWPARLLTVEAVDEGDVFAPGSGLPNKRAADRWRVTGELPAHEALGPQGAHVAALIERTTQLTRAEARELVAARDAARDAAWDAAQDAVRDAARDAAWDAARGAAWDAVRGAAWDAAWGLVVRDLISTEHYDALTLPWRRVVGRIHPEDAEV